MEREDRVFGVMSLDTYRRIEIVFAGISRKTGACKETVRAITEAVQSDFLTQILGENEPETITELLARALPEFTRVDADIVELFKQLPETVRFAGAKLLPLATMRNSVAKHDPSERVRTVARTADFAPPCIYPEEILEKLDARDDIYRSGALIYLFFAAVEAAYHANHEAKLEATREMSRADKRSAVAA